MFGTPLQGTEIAAKWDHLYIFLLVLSAFFFVLVVGAMIYFAIKYRSKPGIKTAYITDNHILEAAWIAIPTALLMLIFVWGYWVYHRMVTTPSGAYEVRVIGSQWKWQFLYENGKTTTGDLFVPANRPVKLLMTSDDVVHSFFVPNFRIKQDVVPGMYTTVWFETTVPGKHQIYCTEYCGTLHSGMLGQVVALDEQQWKAWLGGKDVGAVAVAGRELTDADRAQAAAQAANAKAGGSLADRGKKLLETKGCVACHSVDGSAKVGPSLKGVFGSQVELADGRKVTADENFLRESIEKPNAAIVKGYQPVMPPYQGQLNEQELSSLIEYVKSIR